MKTKDTAIFIRLATRKESCHHFRSMQAIPSRIGYDTCYKPYGKQGRGFYYVPKRKCQSEKPLGCEMANAFDKLLLKLDL